jgi:beta-barrel assembly-enhancing protease
MQLRFAALLFFFAFVLSPFPLLSQSLQPTSDVNASLDDTPSTAAPRSYHDHSIRDIDAIGDRNIGCARGFGNWYTLERQIAMGKQYSDQVEATSKLVKDTEIQNYINGLGQNLVRNSDSLVPFTIKVIESDDINAFALPGGFFYVDSGLILAAENEAELAGVMAHEIAHVAACHVARQNTRGKIMNMASIPLMMLGGPIGYAGYEALTIATPLTYFKFSRRFESEADYLAIQYMYKAGYDPQALTAFFEKIKSLERTKEGKVVKAFQTHPQTPERIEKTQAEINTILPPQLQYKVDTSDFEDTKSRLENLQNHGRLQIQNPNRPTLRKRVPSEVGQN